VTEVEKVVDATHKGKKDSKTYAMAMYGGIALAVLLGAVIAALTFGPPHATSKLGWIGIGLTTAIGSVFVGYVLGTKTLEGVVAVVAGSVAKKIPGLPGA
jgi:hypothetical protein